MKEEIKIALKIWGIVWVAIFLLISFGFLLAQISVLFDYDFVAEVILFSIIFIGSYYLIYVYVNVFKNL